MVVGSANEAPSFFDPSWTLLTMQLVPVLTRPTVCAEHASYYFASGLLSDSCAMQMSVRRLQQKTRDSLVVLAFVHCSIFPCEKSMMQDKVFIRISRAKQTSAKIQQASQASSYLDAQYCYALLKSPLVESPRQLPGFFRETPELSFQAPSCKLNTPSWLA